MRRGIQIGRAVVAIRLALQHFVIAIDPELGRNATRPATGGRSMLICPATSGVLCAVCGAPPGPRTTMTSSALVMARAPAKKWRRRAAGAREGARSLPSHAERIPATRLARSAHHSLPQYISSQSQHCSPDGRSTSVRGTWGGKYPLPLAQFRYGPDPHHPCVPYSEFTPDV